MTDRSIDDAYHSLSAVRRKLWLKGRDMGRLFALEVADHEQIRSIAAFQKDGSFFAGPVAQPALLDRLVAAWEGCKPMELADDSRQRFLETCLNRDSPPPLTLLNGFVAGVADVAKTI
ncbi:hypothetical protein [Caballeronia glebae]|uniref:hypothetical protein n=1 Tax=Caballeronia glebae TaxID=1777143 RepID=UPI0038B795CF